MVTHLYSGTVVGVEGLEVEVEVDGRSADEKRSFIVGLPDTAVKESLQRVDAAIKNSKLPHFDGITTVNLAPADLKKQGPSFDLPIALGMVIIASQSRAEANQQTLKLEHTEEWCILGELALDGSVRAVRGVLPQALEARKQGRIKMMVSESNAEEAAAVDGIAVYPVANLLEAWHLLCGSSITQAYQRHEHVELLCDEIDFDEVKGQPYVRRAAEIAAAGNHNLLMCGSPGSGKSMIASRISTILPPLQREEALETSKIHSVCGLLPRGEGLVSKRPFRSPHHTISDVGLMGGGGTISPGEISIAHHGVLFLDELPEFRRQTLETLRQPLESGCITISRASGTMDFPCQFMLIAAMNPCPCGYHGDPRRPCKCQFAAIQRYRQRISGPLLDRFDLLIEVAPVDPKSLLNVQPSESSAVIRSRVCAARARQQQRYAKLKISYNSQLSGKTLRKFCTLNPVSQKILHDAVDQLALSARAHDRILKVAKTIADLAQRDEISEEDIYEAVQFRAFESQLRGV